MKTITAWTLTSLILVIPGCGGDTGSTDDSGTSGGTDSGDSETALVPVEGDWAIDSGTWVSDECEATFMSTPVGWTLSNSTETGFDVIFEFAEADSMLVDPSCTLSSGDYVCEAVIQDFSLGPNAITLEANAQGSFSSDSAASLEVRFDIECSGGGCDNLVSANPCASVQSFNVLLGG